MNEDAAADSLDDDEPLSVLADFTEEPGDTLIQRVTDSVRRRETATEIGELSLRVLALSFMHMLGFVIGLGSSRGPDDETGGA